MGDIKKPKKSYDAPRHPWQKARIEEEKILVREYGLKNKTEIHRHISFVKRMIAHYKKLNYSPTEQSQKEQEQLLTKAKRIGLLQQDKDMAALLGMTVRDLLERRLQTVVYKKKLARSVKQARQFITHKHILVNGRVVDAPSYVVPLAEESSITFSVSSSLVDELHPERALTKKEEAEVADKKKKVAAAAASKKKPTADELELPLVEEPVAPVAEIEIKDEVVEE